MTWIHTDSPKTRACRTSHAQSFYCFGKNDGLCLTQVFYLLMWFKAIHCALLLLFQGFLSLAFQNTETIMVQSLIVFEEYFLFTFIFAYSENDCRLQGIKRMKPAWKRQLMKRLLFLSFLNSPLPLEPSSLQSLPVTPRASVLSPSGKSLARYPWQNFSNRPGAVQSIKPGLASDPEFSLFPPIDSQSDSHAHLCRADSVEIVANALRRKCCWHSL